MWYTIKSKSGKTVIVQAKSEGLALVKALDVLRRGAKYGKYETELKVSEVKK